MKRGPRGTIGAALLAATALGLLACPSQRAAGPPAPPPSGPEPSPDWLAESVPAAEPAVAMDPVEAGFTHCCGSERYRIEIECGEMLKRCYEKKGSTWRQTYGRHCKEELGEDCYLQDCDAKCQ
jgi:hypothetical protein